MQKYTWFDNEADDGLNYTVTHTEYDNDKKTDVVTLIALTDSAEKADFIAKACNQFSIKKLEEENPPSPNENY